MVSMLTVCILISYMNSAYGTDRPIIGILAQETYDEESLSSGYKSYLSASYVKAVEASGARVVPVMLDKNEDYYTNIARSVNGFLLPGSFTRIRAPPRFATASWNIELNAIRMNNRKIVMPVMGIGMGMEILSRLSALGSEQVTPCQVRNNALSLNFLSGHEKSSLYWYTDNEEIITLSDYNSTSNHHEECITEKTMISSGSRRWWKILTTSKGPKGEVFVSSMESTLYPTVGIMFHPERNAFEWNEDMADPHDARSIVAARLFFDWLTAKARLNNNSFATEEEEMDALIENYNPVFTGKHNEYDFQVYYF